MAGFYHQFDDTSDSTSGNLLKRSNYMQNKLYAHVLAHIRHAWDRFTWFNCRVTVLITLQRNILVYLLAYVSPNVPKTAEFKKKLITENYNKTSL